MTADLAPRDTDLQPWTYTIDDSPLWHTGHSLAGLIVTDSRQIATIAARVAHYSRARWHPRRWRPAPGGPR